MAIVLKLKKGESVERGLKRLKKVLDKEGLIKKLRDDRYFANGCGGLCFVPRTRVKRRKWAKCR